MEKFKQRCNLQMVELGTIEDSQEKEAVRAMVQRHLHYTKSDRAKNVLENWNENVSKFVRVIPKDYKRVLQKLKDAEASGLSGEDAIMAAFEANARDVARVGGG
jgi:glutamate synthase (ferredoxin)